jgi:hypothetical protein
MHASPQRADNKSADDARCLRTTRSTPWPIGCAPTHALLDATVHVDCAGCLRHQTMLPAALAYGVFAAPVVLMAVAAAAYEVPGHPLSPHACQNPSHACLYQP